MSAWIMPSAKWRHRQKQKIEPDRASKECAYGTAQSNSIPNRTADDWMKTRTICMPLHLK